MRRCALLASLGLLLAVPAAGQSREFHRTLDLEPGGSLRLEGSKGSMRITSWDQPQVEIKARIDRPEDVDADYASRAVEATRIDVSGDRRSVTISSNYDDVPLRKGWGRWGERTVPPVHYEIRAPRRLNLDIDSDRGPASVAGFEGRVAIVIDRGELDLRDIVGDLDLEIDRGDQSRIEGLRGSLMLEADRTDLVISAAGLERDSRLEIDRGDVELRLPDRQALTIRTDISRRGDLRSDFPVQWTSLDLRQGEGSINGGGAELFVESDRARVELRRRP